jgi:hypothetical protein
MSDSHSKNAARALQAEQSTTGKDMRLGTIIVVGLISLALFAAGIAWAYTLLVRRQEVIRIGGVAGTPSKLGQSEIGIVDQVLFETDHRLDDWKAANTRRLSTYGWSDRSKGLAHIPIEAAMQQVIASPPDIAGQGVPPTTKIPASVKAGDKAGEMTPPGPATPVHKTAKPGGAP